MLVSGSHFSDWERKPIMAISAESMREHTAELVAGLVRLREWLGSLAGAVATALCASLAIGSLIGLRCATRPARRERAVL